MFNHQPVIPGIYRIKLIRAKVIPLYKKRDNAKCDNYRPKPLLCASSKHFEKAVCNRLYDYSTRSKLFPDNQYGLRTKRSTELDVSELIKYCFTSVKACVFKNDYGSIQSI